MKASEYVIGNCFNCGSKNAEVIRVKKCKINDYSMNGAEIYPSWGVSEYLILKCQGCNEHYFKTLSFNSYDLIEVVDCDTHQWVQKYKESITFWPPPQKRRRPKWAIEYGSIDEDLRTLLNDVYIALNNDLGVLAAIGIRTVFDRASQLHGIDPNQPFKEKLIKLKIGGFITFKDEQFLEVLIDAGSAAAHRVWRPKPQELNAMMEILETFLHRTFILGDISSELRAKVPQRAKKNSR